MATKITSVKALTQVSKDDFYTHAASGDLLFCSGHSILDDAIDEVTSSLWSHVAMLWLLPDVQTWVVLEAIATRGVSCEPFANYVDKYKGGLALAERPVLSAADKLAAYKAGIGVLDDSYSYLQIGEFAVKKLLTQIKITDSEKQFVCSALLQYCYEATAHPLQVVGVPTPEQVWAEPTVVPKYALSK